MYAPTRQALARVGVAIRARLESSDDVRLEGIYAFGSRVRGDHGGESDLDLLVVVGERTPEMERAVIDRCVEEELRSAIPFDPVIKDSASFALERRHHSPSTRTYHGKASPYDAERCPLRKGTRGSGRCASKSGLRETEYRGEPQLLAALSAVRALLILDGVNPDSHGGAVTTLGLRFIRTKLLPVSIANDFKTLMARRTDGDYGDFDFDLSVRGRGLRAAGRGASRKDRYRAHAPRRGSGGEGSGRVAGHREQREQHGHRSAYNRRRSSNVLCAWRFGLPHAKVRPTQFGRMVRTESRYNSAMPIAFDRLGHRQHSTAAMTVLVHGSGRARLAHAVHGAGACRRPTDGATTSQKVISDRKNNREPNEREAPSDRLICLRSSAGE